MVPVSVAFDEMELREPLVKMWFAPYRLLRGTPLKSRIAAV
jgi:hypothetical protein